MIVPLDRRHAGARFPDDAGAFVPEHHRRLHRPVATRRMQIAVTHSGGLHLDENLAGSGTFQLGVFHRERLSLFP